MQEQKLVVKPDMLVKRRGKLGLVGLNLSFTEAKAWIEERMHRDVCVDGVNGPLTHFILEPFCPHDQADEYYVCLQSHREFDEIYFHHEGGVDVGDVDAKALRLRIPTGDTIDMEAVNTTLLSQVPSSRKVRVAAFAARILFVSYHFYFY